MNTKGLMHTNVKTISPADSILDAYILMTKQDIRHLPVLGTDRKLVGILSQRDVQRAMTCKKINDYNQEITLSPVMKVSDFMSWPVYTVNETTHIKLVAELMLKEKVSALVVENEHGYVTGIITTIDLLAYLYQMMESEKRPEWT